VVFSIYLSIFFSSPNLGNGITLIYMSIYVVPVSHLKTGVQGPININIRLNQKYLIITNIRYTKMYSEVNSNATSMLAR